MRKDSDDRIHNRGWKVGRRFKGDGTLKMYRGKGKAQVIK